MSGERLQDHWSSGYYMLVGSLGSLLYGDVSVMIEIMQIITSFGLLHVYIWIFNFQTKARLELKPLEVY